jgi:hypothetical protein
VLEFAIPEGDYSAATLTFSFSNAFVSWGQQRSAIPTLDIGFAKFGTYLPRLDRYAQITDPMQARYYGGGGGNAYGSVDITSAGSIPYR